VINLEFHRRGHFSDLYFTWLLSINYSRLAWPKKSTFVAVVADDIEMSLVEGVSVIFAMYILI
jgi:hypothetical protein